jgi:hypothetical protein
MQCDICGAEATNSAWDIKEGDPVEGKGGKLWSTWERVGIRKCGCDEHPVYSVVTGPSAALVVNGEKWHEPYVRSRVPDFRYRSVVGGG